MTAANTVHLNYISDSPALLIGVLIVCVAVVVIASFAGREKPLTAEEQKAYDAEVIAQRKAQGLCLSQHEGYFCGQESRHRGRHHAVVPYGYDPYFQNVYWAR